jgi:isoquinoline 1-oxidoreductase alpha subunit
VILAGLFWRTRTIDAFGREGKRRHVEIVVNGAAHTLPDDLASPQMPLLWALRELLGLTGTKFGCGVSACGACTVHVDGKAVRSCMLPIESLQGKRVTTIEALGSAAEPHPLQSAWVAHQVPQCGYCQSGMLMAAAALLATNKAPSDADIDADITNICRCGTYPRIRAAIHSAATELRRGTPAA